jgi:hypothetical protein
VRIDGVVKDDARPSGKLTTQWSKVDEPGGAVFTDPTA